jgi:hypothetical protein
MVLVLPAANAMTLQMEGQEVGEFQPLGVESKKVLLYYGNGGEDPDPDPWGQRRGTFYDLKDFYDNLGFPTTYTDIWPADPDVYKVIFLIMPGRDGDGGSYYVSTTQVNQLKDFMLNGGRLVVMDTAGSSESRPSMNSSLTWELESDRGLTTGWHG